MNTTTSSIAPGDLYEMPDRPGLTNAIAQMATIEHVSDTGVTTTVGTEQLAEVTA